MGRWMQYITDPLLFALTCDCTHVGLAGLQSDQSLVAVIGDADNSLSMRWVKVGS